MGLLYPVPEGEQSTARIPAPGVVEHMIRAVFRRREVADRLAILDRDAGALPCPEAREAARRVAAEVRATLRASQRSNIPGNSGAGRRGIPAPLGDSGSASGHRTVS